MPTKGRRTPIQTVSAYCCFGLFKQAVRANRVEIVDGMGSRSRQVTVIGVLPTQDWKSTSPQYVKGVGFDPVFFVFRTSRCTWSPISLWFR
jgi:hypothetical protein